MTILPLYKYYLRNRDGLYLYIDNSTGSVLTSIAPLPLVNSPEGWDKQAIKFGRDEELWGVFQGISGTLKFRGDGKKILETIYYTNSRYPYNPAADFEAYCQLVIEKRNDGATQRWAYDTWFRGSFDFSELTQDEDEDGNFIQILVVENDLKQIFDANKETKYEIPLTGIPEEDTILMQGVSLEASYEWLASNSEAPIVATINGERTWIFPMGLAGIDNTDYFANLIEAQTQGYEIINTITGGVGNTPNDANKFLYTDVSILANVSINIDTVIQVLNYAGPISVGLRLLRKEFATNTNNFATLDTQTLAPNTLTPVNFSYSDPAFTFNPLQYGYFLVFSVSTGAQAAQNVVININDLTFTMSFSQPLPDTDCKAMKYSNYAKLLVKKAFENQASLSSQYLVDSLGDILYKFYDLYPRQLYITCGDALRTLSNPVIKGSLSDLIKDVQARYMCGVGIDSGQFVVETLDYFLRKDIKIATINNPKNIIKKTAKSLLFNDIKVGYPEYRADDLNGRFEWNATQNYKTGFKKITDNIDLTTPYKASVYEIEYLRSEVFSSGNTKDNRNDNSIYLLYCSNVRVSGKATLQKYSSNVTGIPNPTTQYNIALSPQRMLKRWIPYLKSIFNIPDGILSNDYEATYISSERNSLLTTKINGAANFTSENQPVYPSDVPLSGDLPRLFQPLFIEFEAQPELPLLDLIRNNKYGWLEVVNGDSTFGIFIMDVELNGAETDSYKFRGLLHPDSNTSQFID